MFYLSLIRPPETSPVDFPDFEDQDIALSAMREPLSYFNKVEMNDLITLHRNEDIIGYALVTGTNSTEIFDGDLPVIEKHFYYSGGREEASTRNYRNSTIHKNVHGVLESIAWNTMYLETTDFHHLADYIATFGFNIEKSLGQMYSMILPFMHENFRKDAKIRQPPMESILGRIGRVLDPSSFVPRCMSASEADEYRIRFCDILREEVPLVDFMHALESRVKSGLKHKGISKE